MKSIFSHRTAIVLLSLAYCAGCGTPSRSPLPPPVLTSASVIVTVPVSRNDALIRPGALISIAVLVAGKKEIDEPQKRVSEKGSVSLPLLETVNVEGRSLRAAEVLIRALYEGYFITPQVIVEFARDDGSEAVSPWGYVTVLGRVKKPGRIPFPASGDLAVSGAIQQAGGFDTSANQNAIRVSRKNSAGDAEIREVNLHALGAHGQFAEDMPLLQGDVVFVAERRF